ncbi:hypothetical protein ACDI35_10290 [Xanthomonas axonopodis pv. cajani]|nr:hypothetical protein [Xanthomonas citri]
MFTVTTATGADVCALGRSILGPIKNRRKTILRRLSLTAIR